MKLLIILNLFFLTATAMAGDKIGNGGGLWGCVDNRHSLLKGALVDLYEARTEDELNILSFTETNPQKIAKERLDFARRNWPDLYAIWSPHVAYIIAEMHPINSELIVVDDHLVISRPLPQTCSGTWEYIQFANFTSRNQVFVRKDIWEGNVIDSVDKAALIWHEAIYAWLRTDYGDVNSVRTRRIVGYLFSDLPASAIRYEIDAILNENPTPAPLPPPPAQPQWACVTPNGITHLLFLGKGISQTDAKFSSLEVCQKESGGLSFHCSENEIRCENIPVPGAMHVCRLENGISHTLYTGRGGSLIEAEAIALKACAQDNNAIHCSIKSCE